MIRIFLALIVLAFAIPAQAQVERQQILPMVERAQQIEAVLQGTVAADQVFAPSFLKEVSAEQLKTLAGQLVADNGKIVAIEAVHDQGDGAAVFTLRFEKGSANKIPNMGWKYVHQKKPSVFFKDMYEEPRFYFVHSYYVQCNRPEDVLTTTVYGNEYVSAFEKDNLCGVQFHPEKSHKYGMKLFSNFLSV